MSTESDIPTGASPQHAAEDKAAFRERLLAARAAVSRPQHAAGSQRVCARLHRLPELSGARCVLGYAATQNEVDIDAALRSLLSRGITVALPWVEGSRLGVGRVGDLSSDVTAGWRGVREPRFDRRAPLRPHLLDAVIAPGVGFDLDGNRLGYGGGHFDRLLSQLRRGAVVIGVAFDVQVVSRLPVEPHDRRVDVVVTPTRTLRPDT
jgi:5-formyltetrahydrofolate cyclo-ligase